jgi:type IV pilus assembly protein PilC
VIVTSVRALMQQTAPPAPFKRALHTLRRGDVADLRALQTRWLIAGYEHAPVVEAPGQFSRRGGIIDLWPPNEPWPVRIELWGDELDSLRYFDPATQRTLGNHRIDRVLVGPASEALLLNGPDAAERLRQLDYSGCHPPAQLQYEQDIERLAEQNAFRGIELYIPYLYQRPATLLDYLPQTSLILIDAAADAAAVALDLEGQAGQVAKNLIKSGELPPDFASSLAPWETLADALRKHPTAFDSLYCNMVEAGETGGALDVILGRLAFFMEKNMRLKKQVKGALVYPASVLTVAVIVIAIMMIFVIPSFQKMFSGFGAELPLLTQIIVNISAFMRSNIIFILAAMFIISFSLKKAYRKSDKVHHFFDNMFLKMPIFGMLLRKVAVAKFTRTLGTMISSGVPILTSLDIVARTAGNVVIEKAILATRESISQGKTIAEPLMDSGIFPSMVVQMIAVGETTGALDQMLNKIADFYDDEVDTAVSAITSLIEPLLMVFLGGILGTMIVGMYLPIFKMGEVVH